MMELSWEKTDHEVGKAIRVPSCSQKLKTFLQSDKLCILVKCITQYLFLNDVFKSY